MDMPNLPRMGNYNEVRDWYGKGLVSPEVPVSIDRVMENRPFKSTAPLLHLGSDILGVVLCNIHSDSLSSLALVNRDCRQLARSRQFACVCFDYSFAAKGLISLLLKERTRRQSTEDSSNTGNNIGPCIRCVTVSTNIAHVQSQDGVRSSKKFESLDQSIKTERLAKASDSFSEYLSQVEALLSDHATLPYLELLNWVDRRPPIRRSIFDSIVTSNIKHLRLNLVSIDHEFQLAQPPVSDRWQLRTLDLNVHWDLSCRGQGATAPLCASLLRSCAHSLQTLIWGLTVEEKHSFGSDPPLIPQFERLHRLGLSYIKFANLSTAEALLQPSLSVLDLKDCGDPFIEEALQRRGQIRSLETLIFTLSDRSVDHYVEFLKLNSQLSKLAIMEDFSYETSEDILGEKILPVLASCSKAMKSLHLTWTMNFTTIPQSGLALISQIDTLEQICLSAGLKVGYDCTWLIDHDSIREHLSVLPRLKKIAFVRDTYESPMRGNHVTYYVNFWPPAEDMQAAGAEYTFDEKQVSVWESWHRKCMTREAERYASVMPSLEWIYLGQYPMAIIQSSSEVRKLAVPLLERRDKCDKLLNGIFGWEGLE